MPNYRDRWVQSSGLALAFPYFGQAIIILVYIPLLTLTGVEGKTFTPMG